MPENKNSKDKWKKYTRPCEKQLKKEQILGLMGLKGDTEMPSE